MKAIAELPRIAPDVAALCNALAWRKWFVEGQFRVFGSETDVVSCPVGIEFHALEKLPESLTGLSVETCLGSFDLFLEPGLIRQISDICLPGWNQEPATAIRPDWLALYALSQIVEVTGFSSEIKNARAQQDFLRLRQSDLVGTISGKLHVNGAKYAFVIRTCLVQRENVAALISTPAGREASTADPGFLLDVQLGSRLVALNEFRKLMPGDLLILPVNPDGIRVQAWLGRKIHWDGVLGFDGIAVIRGKAKRVKSMRDQDCFPSEVSEVEVGSDGFLEDGNDSWQKSETEVPQTGLEGPKGFVTGFPLGELPVRLDFKLDSKTLTLDTFSRLGGGSVLELDFDLTSALSIEANGTPVGTGQLVQIGDSVGLQIQKWHPRSSAGG